MDKSLVSFEAVHTHTHANTLVTIIANSCKTFIVPKNIKRNLKYDCFLQFYFRFLFVV